MISRTEASSMIGILLKLADLFAAIADALLWAGVGRAPWLWRLLKALAGPFTWLHFRMEHRAAEATP
jgi:hypothetical protein